MAFTDDLQQFIEARLLEWDPTIDLSPGSPAQLQVVTPIVDKVSDDPFSVDIPVFIRDRLTQEFPELAADNGGLLEDMFTNPLQLILEPFKRQITTVKQGQSVRDADLLAEDEQDALGANWFKDRNQGDTSSGPVRVYFAAPVTTRITADKQFSTPSGLIFYPVQSYYITATQMAFNREGSLYFLDLIVQAEKPGTAYNVEKGAINTVEDVPGVVKVANLSPFSTGRPKQTNAEYLDAMQQGLTEHSLVSRRGAITRSTELFDGIRAMQVIGAGESGMDRDLLKGTSQGYLHVVAHSLCYGDWFLTDSVSYRDLGPSHNYTIQAGDTVRFLVGTDVYESTIAAVYFGSDPDHIFVVLAQPFEDLDTSTPVVGQAAFLKAGFITISDAPGGITSEIRVPDGTVHLGGHVDVFVRPTADAQQQQALSNVNDDDPLVASISFTVHQPNRVTALDGGGLPINFARRGTVPEDLLVLEESGDYAGTYHILAVDGEDLRIDGLFLVDSAPMHGRVMNRVRVSLNEPRILKLPFGEVEANDLQTVVGSAFLQFITNALQDFGVTTGDVIRILDGANAGDYVLVRFGTDEDPGAAGVTVDRSMKQTAASLRYEIFTRQTGLTFPLVRLSSLEVLDSTGQGTGITVPYGAPVDVRPVIGLEGATTEIKVLDRQLLVFPDASDLGASPYLPDERGVLVVADDHDTRYTQKLEAADGVVKDVSFNAGNEITDAEINLPPFLWNGRRDKLLAFCTRPDPNFVTGATGTHKTSDLAEARAGDSLSILDGPNQGKYLLRDVRVFDLWGKTAGTVGHQRVALLQVDPELPADPVATAMRLIADLTPGSAITAADLVSAISWASDWFGANGFWTATLVPRLVAALATVGIVFSEADLSAFLQTQALTSYSTGPSAHGDLRLYFMEPVSTELYSGDDPSLFEVLINTEQRYRLAPDLAPAQIYPESVAATSPLIWNRDGLTSATPNEPYFALNSGSAFARKGIRTGDVLEYQPAINDLKARGTMESSWVCVTTAGSSIVQLLLPHPDQFTLLHNTPLAAGQLLFIDSGPDLGAYHITEVLEDTRPAHALPTVRCRVDRVLTHSSATIPGTLSFVQATARGGTAKIYAPALSTIFDAVDQGQYISLYAALGGESSCVWTSGRDTPYLGTFRVAQDATVEDDGSAFNGRVYLLLDKANFPERDVGGVQPNGDVEVFWFLHAEPDTQPADTEDGGKELSNQLIRFRHYDQLPVQEQITIPWTAVPSPLTEATPASYVHQLELPDSVSDTAYAHRVPYRIIRPGVYRISSTAMDAQREGALYYFDVPVVGLGPGTQMNLGAETALGLAGRSRIDGYQLEVENPAFTFSSQEQLALVLPPAVLPVGSSPAMDNMMRLAGQTLRVTYDLATLVDELQAFFDSPQDRVLVASHLVRHFLPAYVYLDAGYVGGSNEALVGADLISLINNIPPERNQLTAGEVVKKIEQRGASQVGLPITLIALVHGIDRVVRGLRSQNFIGADGELVFTGTYQQIYFIAGPNTSGVAPRPVGEQVYLTRY